MTHTHATTRPQGQRSPQPEPANQDPGWHCSHFYYRFDRAILAGLHADAIAHGAHEITAALDHNREGAPKQLQSFIVSGHKADFGLMVLDENPLVVDRVHQELMASALGPALTPTYSFVSVTEVSEYLPSAEQYAQRLIDDGMDPESEQYQARVKAYADREPIMRRERLTPELPAWPAMCFYPMNKKRKTGENWFTLDFDARRKMMAEHAKSGMAFAGRVTQLITVSVGLDDWEWGVTLWAQQPQFFKDIVYRMRFDEASARYAEFGSFFTGYLASPDEILQHTRVLV